MVQPKKSPFKKTVSRLITIVCLGVFIFAAYGLIDIFIDYYQNRQLLSNVQDTFYDAASAETSSSESIRPGFEELLKQNADVVGWITIDGTQIDYPVLQAEDNVHYLTRNYYHDESREGSIYLDYRNDIRSSDERNIVIYGHRMKDGSMFQHLTKFLDKDFFDAHRKIQFDTLYESYEAEIFAVYNTLTNFNYIQTDFDSNEEYGQFLSKIKNESKFETNVNVSEKDTIVTLSTCDYQLDKDEGRLVVQAKLTKK